jgi:hypothetical protein
MSNKNCISLLKVNKSGLVDFADARRIRGRYRYIIKSHNNEEGKAGREGGAE